MARPKSYRVLIAWQKSMTLARNACALTETLPRRESYGLANQMKRAAISISSNVAEGYGRLTDFRHFLGNARGSLFELQTQTELAVDLGYIEQEKVVILIRLGEEFGRILNGLLRSLSPRSTTNPASPAQGWECSVRY
ncbi:MAG TPA: four helix bundle protein [Terracidiphilus sp.]|jgi:four helix bundle protein